MSFKLYCSSCSCKHSDVTLSRYNFGEADIIFNIDSSSSMSDSTWNQTKEFVKKIINTLPISENEIRIGIVQFATTGGIQSQLTGNVTNLLSVVENMTRQYLGGSKGHIGLDFALEVFNTSGRHQYVDELFPNQTFNFYFPFPRIIISITDGLWSSDLYLIYLSTEALKNANVQFTYIITYNEDSVNLILDKKSYTSQPYFIKENNTFETDFNKIITFISGLTLARQLLKPSNTIPNAVDDNYSFISFDTSNQAILYFEDKIRVMGDLKVLIVNYKNHTDPYNYTVPYILLFQLAFNPESANNPASVNKISGYFNLSNETPSRLVKVIRTGIDATGTINRVNKLGTNSVVNSGDTTYIYFQLNGFGFDESGAIVAGGNKGTETPEFTTYSDWSFVVSLIFIFDNIDGSLLGKRICFNVLV